ncbi:MAG: hypothetical protein MUF50_03335 [Planctomycetes bacterium]|jgi:hypothetical protein|nr:hypothetical protein [Planctomycetota bacterium]
MRISELESLGSILNKQQIVKPPAYAWQDLALRIIKELSIPNFKRSAVFKVCKENPSTFINICLNDTKELCQGGEAWKYFFKIIDNKGNNKESSFRKQSPWSNNQYRNRFDKKAGGEDNFD